MHIVQNDPTADGLFAGVIQLFGGELAPGDGSGAVLQAHDSAPGGAVVSVPDDIGVNRLVLKDEAHSGRVFIGLEPDGEILIGNAHILIAGAEAAIGGESEAIVLGVEVGLGAPGCRDPEAGNGVEEFLVDKAKGVFVDLLDGIGNGDGLQRVAVGKGTGLNVLHTILDGHGGQL